MNGLSIVTNGYWDAEGLCLATDGYWCVELIIDDGKKRKPFIIDSDGVSNISEFKTKDELEILMIIKSFLICHS